MTTDQLISTADLCEGTGATLRQLHYWRIVGLVVPAIDATGSGSKVRWSMDSVDRIRALVVLSRESGRMGTERAHLGRLIGHSEGPWSVESDGVRITVEVVE